MSSTFQNIIGGVEEIDNDYARIKVLLFEENNVPIKDQAIIIRRFPPEGYVVARREKFNEILEFDDLIFFQDVYPYPSSFPDNLQVNLRKKYGHTGDPILPAPNSVGPNEQYINLSLLNGITEDVDCPSFYIQSDEFLYGPFKSQRGMVSPKSSSYVQRFKLNPEECYKFGDKQYVLRQPKIQESIVDCSTNTQLLSWLKKKIPNIDTSGAEMHSLKEILSLPQPDPLDKIRFHRLLSALDTLSLTRQEIEAIANVSEKFRQLYQQSIQEMRDDFKKEYLDGASVAIKALDKERDAASQKLDTIKTRVSKSEAQLSIVKEELSLLVGEKDRIIKDIRAHLDITNASTSKEALYTYDEQVYITECHPHDSLEAFIRQLTAYFSSIGLTDPLLAPKIIYQFKYKKCFLANSLTLVRIIAKATGNCKIITQQVEPDWIKFEYLHHNGLQHIWQEAHQNRDIIHFYVLEDINLSSIECYGRPLQDLIEGNRRSLPGENTAWPENLWLIGLPFDRPDNYEFGLPLIPGTFFHWGIFPKISGIDFSSNEMQEPEVETKVPVALLSAHNKPFTPIPSEYFGK